MQVPVRTEVNINVGKRMRILRKSAHLTQHDVAEQVGVSFQQMQKYEKGESRISVELLWRMAHIYRVPMKFFFEGLDEPLYREYVDDSYLNNIYSAESFDLMYAYYCISDRKVARKIFDLVQSMTKSF